VKRIAIIVGAAALGAVLCAGPARAQAPQQTKVATINMLVVMKGYKKFDIFRVEMEKLAQPYKDENKKLQDMFKGWKSVAEDPKKSDKEREDAQKYLVQLKRQIEDNSANASKLLGAREDEKVVQIYHEIQDAVKRYALSNGIHVVLQYTEMTSEPEIYTAANIKRKLQSAQVGACTPMYVADGVDISQAVVSMLNTPFTAAAPAAPAAGPGGQ
jgi:Skp family chaperone for outer membrane proteins